MRIREVSQLLRDACPVPIRGAVGVSNMCVLRFVWSVFKRLGKRVERIRFLFVWSVSGVYLVGKTRGVRGKTGKRVDTLLNYYAAFHVMDTSLIKFRFLHT